MVFVLDVAHHANGDDDLVVDDHFDVIFDRVDCDVDGNLLSYFLWMLLRCSCWTRCSPIAVLMLWSPAIALMCFSLSFERCWEVVSPQRSEVHILMLTRRCRTILVRILLTLMLWSRFAPTQKINVGFAIAKFDVKVRWLLLCDVNLVSKQFLPSDKCRCA